LGIVTLYFVWRALETEGIKRAARATRVIAIIRVFILGFSLSAFDQRGDRMVYPNLATVNIRAAATEGANRFVFLSFIGAAILTPALLSSTIEGLPT
jgi:hypothetical protein